MGKKLKLWQVHVNIRGLYNVEAFTQKEAESGALAAASNGSPPEDVEYAGDGIEYTTLVSGDDDDD